MKHVEVYKNGEDNGWLHKQNFWFDPNHEHGFGIVNLNSIYPDQYFAQDHVKPDTVLAYVDIVLSFYNEITGTTPKTVIEFGTAGGWFGKRFRELGVLPIGIEGTQAGMAKSGSTGAYSQLFGHDLRRPFYTRDGKEPIALCTEVAEHIEPPFSSVLVKSLCDASDLVWFSSEEPNTNPAHIHHPNEMPDKFWINLFDFYGYGCYKLPDWVFDQTEGRGKYIFYNKSVYDIYDFIK